jgi:hypothetical protein
MIISFDTQTKAIDHLRNSDFRRLESGYWVSPSKTVKASIHPVQGAQWVRVAYSEIYMPGKAYA